MGIRACLAGQRVAFSTATEWVALLADAQRQGRLDDELARLQRIPLLVVDLCRRRDYADMRRAAIVNGLLWAGFVSAPTAGLSA